MNVELQFDHSPTFGSATPTFNMSAKVNLTTALPEQAAIGFSEATGKASELHQLLSWSFSLISDISPTIPAASCNKTKSSVGLIVALHPVVAPDEWREDSTVVCLVESVWGMYGRGAILEATDERLGGDFEDGEVERVMVVGLACAHPDCNLRPSIRQAMSMLQGEAPLPVLPARMPTPRYL
ncbi:hypothetical protein ABZP36_034614 [Zizania latifolia]